MPRIKPATPPAPGMWKNKLCGCSDDAALSCAVCWCQCNSAAQVHARTLEPSERRTAFCVTASILWGPFVVVQVFSQTSNVLASTALDNECTWFGLCKVVVDWQQVTAAYLLGGLASLAACASMVYGTYVLCNARRRFRKRDRIASKGDCEDCCVSYWCGCCSIIQMLRQDGVTGSTYRACTTTGV